MSRKPRKVKPLAAAPTPGDYVRAGGFTGVREEKADFNDIGHDLARLRSLIRVVEQGVQGMPCDILCGHTLTITSGEVGELATVAVSFLDKIITDMEKAIGPN